jgi:ubiquinone/menaquinone biosynthesis C-methylase UbiE
VPEELSNRAVDEKMEYLVVERTDKLESCLRQVGTVFDISHILNGPQARPQIIHYYFTNKLTLLFYNWDGFFHYGISRNGKYETDDHKAHARIIEGYVRQRNAKKVMELGSGLGPNIAFLASRNPRVAFEGVDLSNKPLRRHATLPNARFCFGDYHDLSQFEDNSYDVIFVIEALCYSTDKPRVLREVRKKLRDGGLFIIIDGYQRDRAEPLSFSEEVMWRLIAKSLACETIERVDVVENYMRKEFSVVVAQDLTELVAPSLFRFEPLARFYFSHPAIARAVNTFVPHDVAKNTIHILLMPISVERQIGCYYIHVLQKISKFAFADLSKGRTG